MLPRAFQFLVASFLCLLAATIIASPTSKASHLLPSSLNTRSADNLTYPPEGIEYHIPDSDYSLFFYTVFRPRQPEQLSLSSIQAASEHGANIFDTIRERLRPGALINFHKSGAVGGKIDYEGVSIHLSKPAFAEPTYDDAYWIVKGIAGAAKEKGCTDTARIVAFMWTTDERGGAMDVVVAFADLGRYDESSIEVA